MGSDPEKNTALSINLDEYHVFDVQETYHSSVQWFEVVFENSPENLYKVLNIDQTRFVLFVGVRSGFLSALNRLSQLCLQAKTRTQNDSTSDVRANTARVSVSPCQAKQLTRVHRQGYELRDLRLTFQFSRSRSHNPTLPIACDFSTVEQLFGLSFHRDGTAEFRGQRFAVPAIDRFFCLYDNEAPTMSLASEFNLRKNIRNAESVKQLLIYLRDTLLKAEALTLDSQGIKKILTSLLPYHARLLQTVDVHLLATFHTLVSESKRTINGVKVAKFFNQFFDAVNSYETFVDKLEEIYAIFLQWRMETSHYSFSFDQLFVKFPGYSELRKEAVRAQSGKALNKLVSEVESLHYDPSRCPLLHELISDGTIPVSTFFRQDGDETYFLFNDNWTLFEEFLQKHREVGIELAKLASKRSTYEKSFMSYLYFVLYTLPEYLEAHTGKKWTCLPKIVDSTDELEPDRGQPGQTSKKRSVLTPIVDNETCTVTVPYACLQVSGVYTTYTYALNYSILRRGLSIDGAVCSSDLEEKLNGRDDYGLMFYTLTGSKTGRGYPTFLIIFEKLASGNKRVHFHRTHPLRSKDGDSNPIHNWIRTCYNWMVGNVNMKNIVAQQGDLVFVKTDGLPVGERQQVTSYDQHVFERPVTYVPCSKKDSQNILGYFELTQDTVLNHAEHLARTIPAGIYELRQCRSWEANPKGIWTLRID